MLKLKSIRTKLVLLVIGAFLVSTVAIFLIADKQLTDIIDSSQNELFHEKVDAIWHILNLNNERLEKTGLVEAYLDDFQKATLKDLRQSYYTDATPTIYPFIMNGNGDLLMHPVLPEQVASPNKFITDSLLSAKQGDFEAYYNGERRYYSFKKFSEWQWVIGYVVPVKVKYADARQFRDLLILIMGGVMLIILLILALLIYRFTQPITTLTDSAIAMAGGNLDQQIDLGSADEIGDLARSFNQMREAIKGTITELEQENIERKRTEEELAREKEQLAVTLRSIGDAVVTTDIQGNIVLMNRVAEELTGWRTEDAYGQNLTTVFYLVDRDSDTVNNDIVSQILNTEALADVRHQAVLIARDKKERIVASSGAAIKDEQGKIIGAVMVFRDITNQIKIEQELHKNNKLESIGVLAGGIAHDFNNLLSAILGNIDLVLMTDKVSEKSRQLLNNSVTASLRAQKLTQQLLTFSKGGSPIKEITSLDNIIRDAATFCLHGQQTDCHFDIPEDLWEAEIDKGQISQVIQNIVLNAAQAMSNRGLINISCHNLNSAEKMETFLPHDQNFLCITIKDSGPGIPEDQQDKIFDPFFSTKQFGSGMGLAICHSIITKHNGHIKVDSVPGNGTTFSIYLPAVQQKQPPQHATAKAQVYGSHQPTVLIMDDEEMVRKIAEEMLTLMGYIPVTAEDGATALDIYKQRKDSAAPIDLMIMDLTIPGGMGGKEAIKEILAFDPKAKVIVSSGYSKDPVMSDYASYGFQATIVKPYLFKQFSEAVNSVLG